MIDKRCRVRIYVREVRWYIYTSLRGQVCARVMTTPSHNNAPGQCRDSSDSAGVFLALDPKAFYSYIASILLSSIGINFVFKGIVNYRKIKLAILLRGLVRI